MNKLLALVAVLAVVAGLAFYWSGGDEPTLGSIRTIQDHFTSGFKVGPAGASIKEVNCGTATWNPASIATSTIDGAAYATTSVTLTGAAIGDLCLASFSVTSTAAAFSCDIVEANTAVVKLANVSSIPLDMATGSLKTCNIGF